MSSQDTAVSVSWSTQIPTEYHNIQQSSCGPFPYIRWMGRWRGELVSITSPCFIWSKALEERNINLLSEDLFLIRHEGENSAMGKKNRQRHYKSSPFSFTTSYIRRPPIQVEELQRKLFNGERKGEGSVLPD